MKTRLLIKYMMLIIASVAASAQERIERTPAFPGAEGWGRYVTGGRGGKVLHVTNLRDSGYGSLRWACEQTGPRIVVFDISGTIYLQSDLKITNGNLTLAGQTAPGDGICVADYPVTFACPNIIARYMRFRPGNRMAETEGDGFEPDGLGAVDSRLIIVDHCSISWSVDECCSIYGNRFTTVQWCIISQSLRYGGHSKNTHGYGAMMGGEGASYHPRLLVHHDSRCPRLGERPATGARDTTDFRCNVMYNWSGQGCYGAENMNANIVNNYYKPGPGTIASRAVGYQRRICGVGVNEQEGHEMYHVWARLFVDGNVNPRHPAVDADNWGLGIWQQISDTYRNNPAKYNLDEKRMRLSEPMKYYRVTTHSAADAYSRVLDHAGASLSRDSHDALMVSDVREGIATYPGSGAGNAKGIIDSPYDNRPADAPDNWNPWPVLNSTEAPLDTDRDGMPDAWELARGLDPADPADALLTDDEGYTMVEVYINSLVDHITEAQNEGGTADGDLEYLPDILPSYTVATSTRIPSTWNFGNDITLSNDAGKSYGTRGDYIRLARDVRHTLTLPSRAEVDRIRFEGFTYYSSDSYSDASLTEINGTAYPESTFAIAKNSDISTVPSSFEIKLDEPAADRITFTWQGNNPCVRITLLTSNPSTTAAIGTTVDYPTEGYGYDPAWYTIQGHRLPAEPSVPGLYIHHGRKIIIRK